MADDFWSSASKWAVPALQVGAGWYANKQEEDEAKKRTAAVSNDPNYAGLTAAQMAELAATGNVDPAQLFAQQQGLMAPVKEKGQADLMRDLYRKGMLGLATDQQAGQGQTWQNAPGARANPLAAAYYAAQAGADNKAAYDAIKNASDLRTAGVSRVASLGASRTGAQNTAKAAQAPAKSGGFSGMLAGLLGNKGVTDALGGLFKGFGGQGSAASVNTSAGYLPNTGPQMGAAPQAQLGMDAMFGGGIFSPNNYDFGNWSNWDNFGSNWDTGMDLGGGISWSGEYE